MAETVEKKFRHISDIDVWVTPDRNYFVYILLSIFTGFFALDHIYLRSYDTAVQKVLYNVLGLGIWYFWDVIQIFTGGDKIRTVGLSSPFDWTQGIGRGVFASGEDKTALQADKSYILWTFLALFGGFLALDKFYIGDTLHGISKILSVFSPLVFFGILWVAWDAYHAVFATKQTLAGNISLPIPLTWIGYNETPGSIFLPGGAKKGGGDGISGFASAIMNTSSEKLKTIAQLAMVPPVLGLGGQVMEKMDELKNKAMPTGLPTGLPSLPALTALPTAVSPPS